jgi:hypothetical protein
MPPPGSGGRIDPSAVPDFVAVAGKDGGIVGYVSKRYVLPDSSALPRLPNNESWPVYAADLRTVVGHMVTDKGFVPLGVDPNDVSAPPVVVGPSPAPPS